MKRSHSMPFGAAVVPDGVHFRLWAPAASGVEVGVSVACWPLQDGRALVLHANLGEHEVPWRAVQSAEARVIYATPDAIADDRVLQPWSVAWRIESAHDA
jgi:hypothetical protein